MSRKESKFNDSIQKGLERLANRSEDLEEQVADPDTERDTEGVCGASDGQNPSRIVGADDASLGAVDRPEVRAVEGTSAHGSEAPIQSSEVLDSSTPQVKPVVALPFQISMTYFDENGEHCVESDPAVVAMAFGAGRLRGEGKTCIRDLTASPQVMELAQQMAIVQRKMQAALALSKPSNLIS